MMSEKRLCALIRIKRVYADLDRACDELAAVVNAEYKKYGTYLTETDKLLLGEEISEAIEKALVCGMIKKDG